MYQPSIFRARRALGLLTVVGLAAGVAACAAGGEADPGASYGTGGSAGSGGHAGADGGQADGAGGDGKAGGGGQAGQGGGDASLDGDGKAGGGGAAGDASVDGDGAAGAGGSGGNGGSDAGDASDADDDAADASDAAGDACTTCSCKVEICNGLDDNCNGQKDEGDPGGGAACDTGKLGVCQAGTEHCMNGSVKCVQNTAPSTEICDGVDNNCDGKVDESDPNAGASCQTGLKGICNAGSQQCAGGAMTCVPNFVPGQVAETCNGLDDNCDSQVDEGNPGSGSTCLVANFPPNSECAKGVTQCINGQLACPQVIAQTSESCDGKDNDCNGTIDDPASVNGLPCSTGYPGVCDTGQSTCIGGTPGCTATTKPGDKPEVCNGKDDDCDGQNDNGNQNSMCSGLYGSAQYVQTWSCANAACTITQCTSGHSDIDQAPGNGCECAGTSYGNSCANASGVTVPYNATPVKQTGVITTGNGEAWFKVNFTGAPVGSTVPATNHFLAQLSNNGGGEFTMDAYSGCGTLAQCPLPQSSSGGGSPQNLDTWEYTSTHKPDCASSACTNNSAVPTTIYLRIRRINSTATCTPFEVTFTNATN